MHRLTGVITRKTAMRIVLLTIGISTAAILEAPKAANITPPATTSSSEEAYFVFSDPPRPETFVIKLTDPAKIKWARDILMGLEKEPHQVGGIIVKSPACYNVPWSFHLDPQSIVFFGVAVEVCDASIQSVEDGLADVGGAFLPGKAWCPWGSRLLREIPKPDCPSEAVISVSAASYNRTKLAGGALAAAFGSDLAVTTAKATALPLPTALAGTTVKIKDSAGIERLSPLLFVSPTQINYLIPEETAVGMIDVTVTNARQKITTGREMIMQVGPALFTADGSGRGLPAALALRVRGGQVSYEPIARYDATQEKFVPVPIDLGAEAGAMTDQVYLVLFGTGFRAAAAVDTNPMALIDGRLIELTYVGRQPDYVGLDQVNVPLPRWLMGKGEVEVRVGVDDKSSNPVRIHVK